MSPHRPRRIAFYDAYASCDGPGRMLTEIVRRLDRERFEPVAVLAREGPLRAALEGEVCAVEVVPPEPPLDAYGKRLRGGGLVSKLGAARALWRYAHRLGGWLRERQVELLHCNQTRAALQAGPAARRAGVPMVWNVRIRERLPWHLALLGSWCAQRLIPLTEDSLDGFALRGRLRAKATVIPNGVDTERFSPEVDGSAARAELGLAAEEPLILSVGLLARRKAHDVLIRAAPAILRAFPGARIVIAGGVPQGSDEGYEAELRELCAVLGLEKAVRLAGRRDDVPELMAACDVFVLASRQEGFPGAVLEAMSSARPVVVTPAAAAGVREGVTGQIVPVDDEEALGAEVLRLLSDRERAAEMGAAGRREVLAHYSVEAMVRRYEDVYAEVLGMRERAAEK
jgi:glycosyltransferase involved in cell wall biosynthesis